MVGAGIFSLLGAAGEVAGAAVWLSFVLATAGATNGGLYPAAGLCEQLASTGEWTPLMGRRLRGRFPMGLLLAAAAIIVLVLGFDLSAIASIGSAVALMIFTMVTLDHFRVRKETGARVTVLFLAVATSGVTLLTFIFTTLVDEPASMIALLVILVVSIGLDVGWVRFRDRRTGAPPTAQSAVAAESI